MIGERNPQDAATGCRQGPRVVGFGRTDDHPEYCMVDVFVNGRPAAFLSKDAAEADAPWLLHPELDADLPAIALGPRLNAAKNAVRHLVRNADG